MKTITLGHDGPEVGVIGLGTMGLSYAYDLETRRDEAQSIAVVRQAIDAGATLVDTADAYGPHTGEQIVGRALAGGYRDKAILASKVGVVAQGEGRQPDRHIPVWVNGTPDHIQASIDASLTRLGTDHLDLYYLHRIDPGVPLEDSWGALADLVSAGKVRALGLSKATVAQIRLAHAIHPVAAVQSELSLWTRDQLDEVLPYTESHGISFIPYSPLGVGFLTGRFASRDDLPKQDVRQLLPRFQPDQIDHDLAVVAQVRAVAERVSATPAQVALAWVIAQGHQVIPIPGTKTPAYLAENLAAADLTLSQANLDELDAISVAGLPT